MTERYTKVGELNNSLLHGYLDTILLQTSLSPSPTPTAPAPAGFEAIFAIGGLLAVAYLVLRRRR